MSIVVTGVIVLVHLLVAISLWSNGDKGVAVAVVFFSFALAAWVGA